MKNHTNRLTNRNSGLIPTSLKFLASCVKTVSTTNAPKDQVLWASFDRLELTRASFKHVLLLGYSNGFQVYDVEDESNVSELVSRQDNPVTFLQMQPIPEKSEGHDGFRASHPLLLVVASDERKSSYSTQSDTQIGNHDHSSTTVQFYSLKTHSYVHILRFRSTVYMVRCSPRVVSVGLAAQICCFDAHTLENKFSVLTYPVPQLESIGYGPMDVGPRWLAYASNNPLSSNTGRLSPQNLSTSPGVSPSTSPGSASLVARYAMESSKQLASGLINIGDMGYKTLSKYCQERLGDGLSPPASSNLSWKIGRAHSSETDTAGMVTVKDIVSGEVVSHFRAHNSPISALCFDPSGTLLVTASIRGNNINVFRIMPSYLNKGSSTQTYDWSSSHVYLYKLHRGMTSAVIQDICFSNYSHWIAIVSSKGTCHVFTLSPFGGDPNLQIPSLCQPWWSTTTFMANQQNIPKDSPVTTTLNVVSRIKCDTFSWLRTGKIYVPSGAVAAIFHNSVGPTQLDNNALEHLLAYTPSGHLIQYKLVPSMVGEQSETDKDEEFKLKAEPLLWWDVCRRTQDPEREETSFSCLDNSDLEHSDNIAEKDMVKPHERSNPYLSNAEVQIDSGRMPIWQNSKVHFYRMGCLVTHEQTFTKDTEGIRSLDNNIDMEKFPIQEVEGRQRDSVPVSDYFRRIPSGLSDRGLDGIRDKSVEDDSMPHSKLVSHGSVENSDCGASVCKQPAVSNAEDSSALSSLLERTSLSAGKSVSVEAHNNSSCLATSTRKEEYCKSSTHEHAEVLPDKEISEDDDNEEPL